jgi:hypothetical protein
MTLTGQQRDWIEGCRLASLEEHRAILLCVDSYHADQLARCCEGLLRDALTQAVGRPISVQLRVGR